MKAFQEMSEPIKVCNRKQLRNHRANMLNKHQYKVRTDLTSPLRFHDV